MGPINGGTGDSGISLISSGIGLGPIESSTLSILVTESVSSGSGIPGRSERRVPFRLAPLASDCH